MAFGFRSVNIVSSYREHKFSTGSSRAYLKKEKDLGRMLGPFQSTANPPPVHFNTGKWCLVTDLRV